MSEPTQTEHAGAAQTQAARVQPGGRQPVRVGPIVWGSILLLVASITGAAAVLGTWTASTFVLIVIAFGALIVVAGLIGAVSRARWR